MVKKVAVNQRALPDFVWPKSQGFHGLVVVFVPSPLMIVGKGGISDSAGDSIRSPLLTGRDALVSRLWGLAQARLHGEEIPFVFERGGSPTEQDDAGGFSMLRNSSIP